MSNCYLPTYFERTRSEHFTSPTFEQSHGQAEAKAYPTRSGLFLPVGAPHCNFYLLLVYIVGGLHKDDKRRHLLHMEAVTLAVDSQVLHGLRPPREIQALRDKRSHTRQPPELSQVSNYGGTANFEVPVVCVCVCEPGSHMSGQTPGLFPSSSSS